MDFIKNCSITSYISKNELDQKYKAFQKDIDYNNLYLDIHGYRFRFEKKMLEPTSNEFTLSEYKTLLKRIKEKYIFIDFRSICNFKTPTVIWRHDVDVSVHNAYKLAKIEQELGIRSSYFFMLGNWFYDIRDCQTNKLINEIKNLGHIIGLHYDFEYFPGGKVTCFDTFLHSLKYQKSEIEHILGSKIDVVSFHDPGSVEEPLLEKINENHIVLDMVNVYSIKIKNEFKYCSDSNGLWRFEKLGDLINPELYPHLHILTHPEWWTEYHYTPRKKIEKALLGRARTTLKRYDELLKKSSRPNF